MNATTPSYTYLFVCLCLCVGCTCQGMHMFTWKSEVNLWELVLSFNHVGSWDKIQVVSLGCRHLYPLSHCAGPLNFFVTQNIFILANATICKKKINIYLFYMWVFHLLICMCTLCMPCGCRSQKQTLDILETRGIDGYELPWVLGIKLGSSARPTSTKSLIELSSLQPLKCYY